MKFSELFYTIQGEGQLIGVPLFSSERVIAI